MTWNDLARDVRYTFRSFGRDSGFFAIAVLIIGLGIGANKGKEFPFSHHRAYHASWARNPRWKPRSRPQRPLRRPIIGPHPATVREPVPGHPFNPDSRRRWGSVAR
jgi:hypothetical protein